MKAEPSVLSRILHLKETRRKRICVHFDMNHQDLDNLLCKECELHQIQTLLERL